MSWILDLFGPLLFSNGVPIDQRKSLNVESPLEVVDDPKKRRSVLRVAGGATIGLSTLVPPAVASLLGIRGTSTAAAREDHTHAHGSLAGGSLHAPASDSSAGFVAAGERSTLATLASLPRPIPGSATTGSAIPVTGAGAASDSSGRVALGFDDPHNLAPGDRIYVHGVLPEAEGAFTVEIDDAYTVWLVGTTFVGTWSGSGVIYKCADLLPIPAPDDATTVAIVTLAGVGSTGIYRRIVALAVDVFGGTIDTLALTDVLAARDMLALESVTVASIANAGGAIEVTTHQDHGAFTGDTIAISGVGSGADGTWAVTRTGASTLTLDGSTYSATGTVGKAILGWREAFAAEWSAGVLTIYVVGSGGSEAITWSAQALGIV